ncbi:hypothetical protein H4W31_004790 [Plantactinospora soyae]|uniref:Uncharacterized protein n=1 Tax=Plantactinospora soyae TaxID=1544732 RepID=A0A927QZK1_9ACTN|nr:hypothetical protein [Plantactinospora soyae]
MRCPTVGSAAGLVLLAGRTTDLRGGYGLTPVLFAAAGATRAPARSPTEKVIEGRQLKIVRLFGGDIRNRVQRRAVR